MLLCLDKVLKTNLTFLSDQLEGWVFGGGGGVTHPLGLWKATKKIV